MNLDNIIEEIINDPLFLKLKEIIENNAYHDHESTYNHLLKTKDISLREFKGEFITNSEAKKAYEGFINQEVSGVKKSDIMILTALVHDIGKIIQVKEGKHSKPLMMIDSNGNSVFPGHEYWGSTIVGEILKGLSLPEEAIKQISTVVRLHDTFSAGYFEARKDWGLNLLLNDIKSRAENLYKEVMFNIYCDCFTAKPFQAAKERIIQIFNDPKLYLEREYVIT